MFMTNILKEKPLSRTKVLAIHLKRLVGMSYNKFRIQNSNRFKRGSLNLQIYLIFKMTMKINTIFNNIISIKMKKKSNRSKKKILKI